MIGDAGVCPTCGIAGWHPSLWLGEFNEKRKGIVSRCPDSFHEKQL